MDERDKIATDEWTEGLRILKCHRDGCDSPAEFHVGIDMHCGAGAHRHHLMAPTTLKVCKRHMRAVPPYVFSDANKSRMALALMQDGMPFPDFGSAAVVFVPIRAAETNWQAAREQGARH